jgi:phosphoribosylaminoimidazole-succinocarboxamide synthase
LHASGKVRDVYNLDGDHLLFVATDRISAFDYVLATGIPHKGRVLTQISLFWFDFLKDIVPNHFVTADVNRTRGDPPARRRTPRPLHDGDARRDVSRRVRRPRLPLRLRMEGVQSDGHGLRHPASGRG